MIKYAKLRRGGRFNPPPSIHNTGYNPNAAVANTAAAPYVSQYVAPPVEEYRELFAKKEELYERQIDRSDKIDYTLGQLALTQGDEGIRNEAATEIQRLLAETREKGDWENADMAVRKAGKYLATNPELRAGMKNYEAVELEKNRRREMGAGNLPFGDDPDKWTTIDPETGEIRMYNGASELQLEWDNRRESMFNDIMPELTNIALRQGKYDQLQYGNEQQITADKMTNYIDGVGEYKGNGALQRYLDTAEGRQELRAIQELGNEPITDRATAILHLKENLKATAFERLFKNSNIKYKDDTWKIAAKRARNQAIKDKNPTFLKKYLMPDPVTGMVTTNPAELAAFIGKDQIMDLNRSLLAFGKNTALGDIAREDQNLIPIASKYVNLSREIAEAQILHDETPDNTGKSGLKGARALNLKGKKERLAEFLQNNPNIDEIKLQEIASNFKDLAPKELEVLEKYATVLTRLPQAKVNFWGDDNVQHEAGDIYFGLSTQLTASQLGYTKEDINILNELAPGSIIQRGVDKDDNPLYELRVLNQQTITEDHEISLQRVNGYKATAISQQQGREGVYISTFVDEKVEVVKSRIKQIQSYINVGETIRVKGVSQDATAYFNQLIRKSERDAIAIVGATTIEEQTTAQSRYNKTIKHIDQLEAAFKKEKIDLATRRLKTDI